jgi:hypothetical protein
MRRSTRLLSCRSFAVSDPKSSACICDAPLHRTSARCGMEEALRLAPSRCRCSSAAPSLPAGRVPRRSAQGGSARPRGSQARARTTRVSIEQGSRPTRRRAVWGARFVSQKSRKATRTTLRLQRPAKTLVRLLREALTGSCASRSPGFSISRLQVGGPISFGARTPSGRRPRVNRLRLGASAARTARPACGESLFELTFQTLGRDVMFGLNLHRDLDPDPRGLEADDLHVVGHVLPVRMVIALAFFKRIFTRSLSINQAHGSIVEVTEPVAPARTRRSGAPGQKDSANGTHRSR